MCEFVTAIELGACGQAYLLKKQWHTSSDLQITCQKFSKAHHLLCLTEISYKTVLIHSSVEVARASFAIASARNKDIRKLTALEKDLEAADKTLN